MLPEVVIVRNFAQVNNGILAVDYTALDTTDTENDLILKTEVEERNFHRMAKVHNFLEMWQGSQNLHATLNESRPNNQHVTAVGWTHFRYRRGHQSILVNHST